MSRDFAHTDSAETLQTIHPPGALRGGSELRIEQHPKLAEVVAMTREMFTSEPAVEIMSEPEDPENPFVVLTVEYSAELRELIRLQLQWHERIDKLAVGDFGAFRLSIVPI